MAWVRVSYGVPRARPSSCRNERCESGADISLDFR